MNKHIKKILVILSLMLIVIGIAGCGKDDIGIEDSKGEGVTEDPAIGAAIELEDSFGNKLTLEKAPERIISLAPNNTEILFALGLDDEIVGVTEFCDYPEKALEKEKIGDYNGINLEKVIELEPDLVINYGPGDESQVARLKEAGIQMLAYLPESIEEVIDTITSIGIATGKEEEAKALTESMLDKKDEIVDKVKGVETRKVFYEVWHEPLMTAGPGSFMDSLIKLAGGENIAADAEGQYPQYDLEQLIERDPEVYLTADDSPEKTLASIVERPGFDSISAVKNGNIHILDANISSRPGPRIVEGLELVARAIHPKLFE